MRTDARPVYAPEFYEAQESGSLRSARRAVPLVLDAIPARSVIDVGCGVGTWLRAFAEAGVDDYLGVDGEYVNRSTLHIDSARFVAHDLTRPLQLPRTFDLAVCLEVAEHLPGPAAPVLIEGLTRLAPVVLFSAAVPHSGGHHHINEQWPNYWAALFEERHYVVVDLLRSQLWNDDSIDWWYAQNALLFVAKHRLAEDAGLREAQARTDLERLAVVHPRMLAEIAGHRDSLRHLIAAAPSAMAAAAKRRLTRLGQSGSRAST